MKIGFGIGVTSEEFSEREDLEEPKWEPLDFVRSSDVSYKPPSIIRSDSPDVIVHRRWLSDHTENSSIYKQKLAEQLQKEQVFFLFCKADQV